MLNYALFIQLHTLQAEVSKLTKALTENSFLEKAMDYLQELSDFADENRLYIASDIAITSQKIMTFKSQSQAVTTNAKRGERKEKMAYAVKCIDELQKTISKFLEKDRKTYDDCQDVWRQIVSRLMFKINDKNALTADDIVAYVLADSELSPYYAHILGLVGVFNAKAVLEVVLPQLGIN